MNEDILKIANQACLNILVNGKLLTIKHKFRLRDKSTLGIIFLLIGGLFLLSVPLIKTTDITTKIIGFFLGLSLAVFSILTLIKQIADGLQINENNITFRYNLKKTIIPLSDNLKIKMKTEVRKIKRADTIGSDFIIVTHFLDDRNIETPIFKFMMNNSNAYNAEKLGNELTRIIKMKLQP